MERTPVLAICGSLRAASSNRALLDAFEAAAPDLRFVGSHLVPHLPLFNPDLGSDDPRAEPLPAAVREFRLLASAAAGAVIVSPEYIQGPSGVTKNALDWLTDSIGIGGKPVLLGSASPGETGGFRGIAGLIPTLQLLGARLIDPVTVSHATSRLDVGGVVRDPSLAARIRLAMSDVRAAIQARAASDDWSLVRT